MFAPYIKAQRGRVMAMARAEAPAGDETLRRGLDMLKEAASVPGYSEAPAALLTMGRIHARRNEETAAFEVLSELIERGGGGAEVMIGAILRDQIMQGDAAPGKRW
jgi:hypothetical protein